MIAVSLESRGLDVETKIFDHLDKLTRTQGFKRINLDLIDTNVKAKKLYKLLG